MTGWTRLLLLPHVLRAGARAPRGRGDRWDRYWAGIRETGDGGDVLWDASGSDEAGRYLALLAEHADGPRPVVDLGCGNGRFTRALAERFPRAVGVDVAPHAVARARSESRGVSDVEFRTADMTVDGAGARLATELGACHVFVRGVLHVLDAEARRRFARNVRALTGGVGTVLLAETNFAGSPLGYLESLGGSVRGLPPPVTRAIASGIPVPRPFGRAELEGCFPPADWEQVVLDDHAAVRAVPMRQAAAPESIPALVAVVRPWGPWDPSDAPDP